MAKYTLSSILQRRVNFKISLLYRRCFLAYLLPITRVCLGEIFKI
ncbi:hypothetical protein [uncultured Campylobacter sp.]|nr:hypothetical protein [uncultured Campylobacter sp.]